MRDTLGKDNVYLLAGEEEFLKEEFIERIKNRLLGKSGKELNFSLFSAKDTPLEEILAVAATLPFAGKRRVVVVKHIEKLEAKKRDALFAFIKKPADNTCLILESSRPAAGDKFLASLSKYSTLIKAEHPSGRAMDEWIRKTLSLTNKRMTREASALLQNSTAPGLSFVSKELEKIVSFVGDKTEICADDVEKIVGRSVKEDVFVLVDYISKKDAAAALFLCKNLTNHGKRPHEIIGLIGWYLRRMLSAKITLQKGGGKQGLLKEAGPRRYHLDTFMSLLDNFKVDELRAKLKLLFAADKSLKRSSSKPDIILDVLITRLCAT